LGYIECKLLKTVNVKGSQIIIGEAVHAAADKKVFSDRYLIEKKAGRPLHHLGGQKFMVSSGDILS
jgi:flavin reductase (DIM6/NTAB) family NADH-FMN oxidoreductase RutF